MFKIINYNRATMLEQKEPFYFTPN